MAKYGKTWWGEQWLKSLSYIDYSNRLPRGSTYASQGAVVDIKINGNKISAKVQGTRRTPYKVSISVPIFSISEKKVIMSAIKSDPMMLSDLLNRNLPQGIMDIAKARNISIFPASWKDFGMDCSCPDWAVPCKHIAAVIYILANEIDRNPFLVFNLHDLDILKEIKKSGMVADSSGNTIAKAKSLYSNKQKNENTVEPKEENIDFSDITDISKNLFSLLTDKPLFCSTNFKTVLKKAYKTVERSIKKYNKEETEAEPVARDYEIYENVEIILNNELFYFDTVLTGAETEKHFGQYDGFKKLAEYINAIPSKFVGRLSSGLKGLYYTWQFAKKLLSNSAYIPQLLQLANNIYTIRWIPALMNKDVKKQFEIISQILPSQTVKEIGTSHKSRYMNRNEQAIAISSMFIEYFIVENTTTSDFTNGAIQNLFFNYDTNAFSKTGEREIPTAIHQWLNPFFVSHGKYVPVIQIEEDEDNYFAINLMVENRENILLSPIELSTFLSDKKYAIDRMSVLSTFSVLTQYYEDLKEFIQYSGEIELTYSSEEFTDILFKILPAVEMLGIRVLLPKALKNLIRPQASLSLMKTEGITYNGFLSIKDIFDFKWQIALGKQFVNPEEFARMVKNLQGIVKIKDQYIFIDKKEIERLLKQIDKDPELNNHDLLKVALSEDYKGANVNITEKSKKIVAKLLKVDKIAVPKDIKAQLRPYQERGYEWLYKNAKAGFGCIIADDMGLGKTLQVITTFQQMKNEGRLAKRKGLVVVPTTLITNWMHEIQKFAPDLKAAIYHGTKRTLETENIDIIITTYGVLRSDEKIINKKKWEILAIDEAQNIKNPTTAQTKAVKKIKAPVRIAMSGTPVENRLSEYWSIFDFINKGYLGSLKYFRDNFATPIETDHNHDQLDVFKKITSPFIIRRLKSDKSIINDLPDKIQNNTYNSLTKEQAALYQSVVKELMPTIETNSEDGIKRRGLIFKLMIALKQICNHPVQYLKKGNAEPEISGKTQMLFNLLDSIYENNEKVLIFTQFKEMGVLLEKMITKRYGKGVLFLSGSTSRKKRDEYVNEFQNKSYVRTFILSIKAGGTGLNLTAASNVIHYDLWWNPAVENQATDRAYRIGQKNNVMVYRMLTQGTFEEKINEMLDKKRELANLTVKTGENWLGDLSDNEIAELVKIK